MVYGPGVCSVALILYKLIPVRSISVDTVISIIINLVIGMWIFVGPGSVSTSPDRISLVCLYVA